MTQPNDPTPDFQPGGNQPNDPQAVPPQQGAPGQPFPGQPQGNPGQADPYAQQAQAGAQPGQQAPGQPGPYPHPGVQAPSKPGPVRRVLSFIVIAAVVGVGGFALYSNFVSNAALKAGNCIVITGEEGDLDHKEVKCDDDANYSYLVTEVTNGEAACGEAEVPYTISSKGKYSSKEKTNKTTCLIPNFIADKCYKIVDDTIWDFQIADCAGADFKVTKVEESATANCETPSEPLLEFAKGNRSYCGTFNS